MLKKVLGRVTSFLIGILIAGMMYFSFIYVNFEYERFKPVNWIFEASLSIPNFVAGENPHLTYYRNISEDFRATPIVEIKNAEGFTVCRTDVPREYSYEENEHLDPNKVTLEWYVASKCVYNLIPGYYFLYADYILQRPNEPDRHVRVQSNIFEVKAPTEKTP